MDWRFGEENGALLEFWLYIGKGRKENVWRLIWLILGL
jgi:hypothetical protein